MSSYAVAGSGGRQPIGYAGPAPSAPHRRRRSWAAARWWPPWTPAAAKHPWLAGVVKAGPGLDGQPIGYVDDATDPEKWFDQVGPLDGGIDPLAGHGTFIAGLIHQACPDADIVAWRIVGSDGPVVESDLVKALADIAEVARRHRDGEEGGHPIDVLSLSMGYYHETPQDLLFDPTMYDILRLPRRVRRLRRLLGRQRRHRPADVPGGLRALGRRQGRRRSPRTRGADHLGRGAEPQRHGRPVQQCRALGARLRARCRGDEHPAASSRVAWNPPPAPRPTCARASRSTPTTSRVVSRFGAARRSRRRCSPARWLRELVDGIDPDDDDRAAAVARAWKALSALTDLRP